MPGKIALETLALSYYTNTSCVSKEEFLEDLYKYKDVKRLVRKIGKGNSTNIRLLVNHTICFTNNFELDFSKKLLLADCTEAETSMLMSVFLYLNFLTPEEYDINMLNIDIIKMLKDNDK